MSLACRFFALGVVLSLVSGFHARASETEYWSAIQVASSFKQDLKIFGELTNRYSEEDRAWVVRATRLGLRYALAENFSYAFYNESRSTDSGSGDEVRFGHELSRKFSWPEFDMNLRGRLEHREFQDSSSISNRARLQIKSEFSIFEFISWTPFAAIEQMYTLNTAGSRPDGSTESRYQLGALRDALGGTIEVSYVARETASPSTRQAASSRTRFNVYQLTLKWEN